MATIFILNDQPSARLAIRRAIEALGHRAHPVRSLEELQARVAESTVDALVADLDSLPEDLSLEAALPGVAPQRVVATSSWPGSDRTHQMRQSGVFDCLPKPLDFEVLGTVLERCLEGSSPGRVELATADELPRDGEIVYASTSMREIMEQIDQVAGHDITVLITGESGTGKELVAQALHQRGLRARKPFVVVNCGAIPEELLESELFGHEKGSFTDAGRTRKGRFEVAGDGTLFLDEIGEMSLKLQVKLLRALQEREIQRVGGDATIRVKARIVAATNRDLRSEVGAQRFREDLLHRLMVVNLLVPPLRDRPADLRALIPVFLRRFSQAFDKPIEGVSADAWELLAAHSWPGNVRELEHVLQRAVVFARGPILEGGDLQGLAAPGPSAPWEAPLRAHVDRRLRAGDAPADVVDEITTRAREIVGEASSGDNLKSG